MVSKLSVEAPVFGRSRRGMILWAGVAVALYLVTLAFVTIRGNTIGIVILAGFTVSLLGAGLAVVQAATNGSVALSWLLPLTGYAALWTEGMLVAQSATMVTAVTETAPVLVNVVFLGAVAHLLGTAIAEWGGELPRPVGERERHVLVAILILTGAHFVLSKGAIFP